jgi:NAD(P)-dependent dehydrogenase (short-subunit alcohol dehydrogenase family)
MGILDGKVAVVTGAGRGLGRAHALLLARHGASVVVNDPGAALAGSVEGDAAPAHQVVDEIVAAGGKAVANLDSCADWKAAAGLVEQAVDTFGDLNILVNNAGVLRDGMIFNMEESDWDSVMEVHLKGHAAPSVHAAKYWRSQAKAGREIYGRIINTSSESGLYGNAGQANYSTAKAGIAALTIVLGRELAKYNVTANAIAPRARTRMTTATFAGYGQFAEGAFDARAPEAVSPLVGWLASPAAAGVNGQMFVVYGSVITLVQGWSQVASIDAGERIWTVEELAGGGADLFPGCDLGLPPWAATTPSAGVLKS